MAGYAEDRSAAVTVGFIATAVYIVALLTVSAELSTRIFGMKPYLTWVAGPIAFVAALASGNLFRMMSPGPARWFTLFAIWMVIGFPFGVYRQGSLDLLQEAITKQYVVLPFLICLVVTRKQMHAMMMTMGLTALLVAAITWKYGEYSGNRLIVRGTSLGNPNDLATHVVLALPFCLWIMLNHSKFSIFRFLGMAGMLGMLLITLRTSSRAGLLALAACFAVWFFKVGGRQKIVLVVTVVACMLLAAAIFPGIVFQRLGTFFSSQPAEGQDARTLELATASSEQRMEVLKQSLVLTMMNPVFGVGAGNFVIAEATAARDAGERADWLGTHNSYTQASSEGGMLAFIFFTGSLVSAIRMANSLHTRTKNLPQLKDLSTAAFCLLLSMAGFAVCIFFAHLAFRYYVPLLLGLTIALKQVVDRELANLQPQPVAFRQRFSAQNINRG